MGYNCCATGQPYPFDNGSDNQEYQTYPIAILPLAAQLLQKVDNQGFSEAELQLCLVSLSLFGNCYIWEYQACLLSKPAQLAVL
jgi:hypothetical protein